MNFLRQGFFARLVLVFSLPLSACGSDPVEEVTEQEMVELTVETNGDQERRFSNIRQLTFGGENAEAYFSTDGSGNYKLNDCDETEDGTNNKSNGEIIDKESNLSRIPPCPFNILLVSLILISLFNFD